MPDNRLLRITAGLVLICTLATPALVSAQGPVAGAPERSFVPGEIIVKFRPQVGLLNAQRALLDAGLQPLEVSAHSGIMRVQVAPGQESGTIAALKVRENVEFATYNHRVWALGDPSDTYYSLQWALNQGQDHDIDAPEAWAIATGSSDVMIAVIDTGIDLDHPDLVTKIEPGYNYISPGSPPEDDYGHGTHVAGIAVAASNNELGIAGVSWGARLMPLKAVDSSGGGNTFDLTLAIEYAVDRGAQIINMSLGGNCDSGWPDVDSAVDYAASQGVLVVAASGNSGSPSVLCPAAIDGVMAVGATDFSDSRAWYSNYGADLDVVAPGTSIYSTYLNGRYGYLGGTSMATPHVAGLAALIWSFDPSLSADSVQSIIQRTADDLGTPGWDLYYGHGRINAGRALESMVGLELSATQVSLLLDDSGSVSTRLKITTKSTSEVTWTASVSPEVSWLRLSSTSGVVSADAPAWFDLTADGDTLPGYGTYDMTVTVTGLSASNTELDPKTVELRLVYVSKLYMSPAINCIIELLLRTAIHC